MSGSADALTALGSDLAFSVSYTIALELRESAESGGFNTHELVAIVFLMSILLMATPSIIVRATQIARHSNIEWLRTIGTIHKQQTWSAIIKFIALLLSIARRIVVSLLVQLVANAAVAQQGARSARILSLLSVAVFFLFLESGASTPGSITR